MRPHFALQASIIAFIEASRVTSASNAAHLAGVGFLRGHRDGFFRRLQIAVDAKHLRALLREADDGRPPVAHAGSRALPRADDDRDLVLKAHDPISLFRRRPKRRRFRYPQWFSPRRTGHAMAGLAKSSCSHYVPAPMNDLFDKSRPRRNLDGGRVISIRGAREHNLKNIDVEIPRDQLVVFTGLSGSGKSSLAFDTIYAEGQRRYVESRCRPMRASSSR